MKTFIKLSKYSFLLLMLFAGSSCSKKTVGLNADVIIYGGTASAVTAAVEVSRSGKSVIMVSPDKHLGGLTSGGLGWTDTGDKSTVGGLAREFYHRIYLYYSDSLTWKWQQPSEYGNRGYGTVEDDGDERTMWVFEPSIAEKVFEDFIKENNITVFRDEWLDRDAGVKMDGPKIISITTLSGKTFSGKIFIDATYEGDLMAAAGVSYRVGREACSEYNEKWDGVQSNSDHLSHYFTAKIDPYKVPGNPESGLLYGISSEPVAADCTGDNKIQAYCFRMCLSNHPENRVPFTEPDNYDPLKYELLIRVFDSGWREWFRRFNKIPNRKTDNNNHGPFSTDFIGMNYEYPEASYEQRKDIIKEHEDYQKGLFYFVATDERVPEEIRAEMQNWGLAKDEFADNGNWPHQLYIREARRMIGKHVITEHDVLGKTHITDPVGTGSYSMDSHNVQRYVTSEGYVQNEGDMVIHLPGPYSVPYGSLIPKEEECSNLLVPVCVSTSHIAYGSIRMEPVFMILGQSAAVAAVLALDKNIPVQNVTYEELKEKLIAGKQRLLLEN